jgi:hypothetical protein
MTVVSVPRIANLLGIAQSQLGDLEVVVKQAESLIAERVGPLSETTVIDQVTGGSAFALSTEPVRSLTSVAAVNGSAVDVSGLYLDGGIVRRLAGGLFTCDRYIVTYKAGHSDADGSDLPGGLERAVVELTRHLWRPKRGVDRTARTSADADTDRPPGFLWPYAVLAALEPYTLPGFA